MVPPKIRQIWPLFDLAVRTPHCELRYPTPESIAALLVLPDEGIVDPGVAPFVRSWHTEPSPERERNSLRWYASGISSFSPEDWHLEMVVHVDGEVVGAQMLAAKDFPALRSVNTGSWLVRRAQGRGIGTAMRQAALELAFGGLRALEAHTSAFADNPASNRVSEKVGYVVAGERRALRDGVVAISRQYVISAERWQQVRPGDVEIVGLEPCLAMFGLEPGTI